MTASDQLVAFVRVVSFDAVLSAAECELTRKEQGSSRVSPPWRRFLQIFK